MGKDAAQHVGVSDDYGAYRNLFARHQLCWAHPLRKLRDLKDSPSLTSGSMKHATHVYEAFAKLYASLRKLLERENGSYGKTKQWRSEYIAKEQGRLEKKFQKIATPHPGDPKKLKTLKESLLKNKDSYFTCLS